MAKSSMEVLVKEYKPYFDVLADAEQQQLNKMLERIFYKVCEQYKEGKN